MEELAKKAAQAMDELGSSGLGTWQERKAALLRAGERVGSGFEEVLGWFDVEIE